MTIQLSSKLSGALLSALLLFPAASAYSAGHGAFIRLAGSDPSQTVGPQSLISRDGSVVVFEDFSKGYIWRQGGLQQITGATIGSIAALTPDGRSFVGDTGSFNGTRRAFHWRDGRMHVLPGRKGSAFDVSDDGRFVVGIIYPSPGKWVAVRWDGDRQTQLLLNAQPGAITPDGRVVVGTEITPTGYRVFRWEDGKSRDLGTLPGLGAEAQAVSADGRVIAGNAHDPLDFENTRAFRWSDDRMTDLGTFGGARARFLQMNANGAVLVGWSENRAGNPQAFRWEAGRMENLGTLGGAIAGAFAVSESGAVVVGTATVTHDADFRAFRWTRHSGMQSVEEWLRGDGVAVSDDIVTDSALGVSGDGTTIFGTLQSGEAFIARSAKGLVTLKDVQSSLYSTATALNTGRAAGELVLNGIHGHPLQRRTAPGRSTTWVAGDFGSDSHSSRDGTLYAGEVGGGHNFGPAQFNLAAGGTGGDQDTALGGQTEFKGRYVIADAIVPSASSRFVGTVTLFHQRGEMESERGYLNAGVPDMSAGKTDVATWGGALRVDAPDALVFRRLRLTPYAKMSVSLTEADAYAESGGGFPATYDARRDTLTDATLGLNTAIKISSRITVVNTFEGIHRFQGRGSRISGEVVGVSTFNLPGDEYDQNWLRGTLGVDCEVGRGVFSISLNGTTQGEASDVWLASSFQVHF